MPLLSVIIPTYNRKETVVGAIESAFRFLDGISLGGEVIMIDDASTDGTTAWLAERFQSAVASSRLRLLRNGHNLGVTGSRNVGVSHAAGKWLLLLDSDDRLLESSAAGLASVLEEHVNKYPIVFFRCIDRDSGVLIGPIVSAPYELSIADYVRGGTPGECVPVIRREVIEQHLFQTDLRGFESYTYAEIIQHAGAALVSPLSVRAYNTSEDGDRLSTKMGLRKRSCLLARGYVRYVGAYLRYMSFRSFIMTLLKTGYHSLRCLIFGVWSQ